MDARGDGGVGRRAGRVEARGQGQGDGARAAGTADGCGRGRGGAPHGPGWGAALTELEVCLRWGI